MSDSSINPYYHEAVVDTNEALKLLDVFDSDEIHSICHGILLRSLFSRGIHLESLSKKRSRGEDKDEEIKNLQIIINKYWLPVAKELLRYGPAVAYVLYTLEEIKDPVAGYVKCPVIFPRNLYSLRKVMLPNFSTKWIATPKENQVQNISFDDTVTPEGLHLFFIEGFEPCKETGMHRSIVAPTIQGFTYIKQLYDSFVKAQIQRSHPPIVIQQSAANSNTDTNIQQIERMSTGITTTNIAKRDFETIQAQNSLQNADDFYVVQREKTHGTASEIVSNPYGNDRNSKFYPTTVDAKYPLPSGYEMASPQPLLPEPQNDLLNYNAARLREIFASYGIPSKGIVLESKANTTGAASSVDDNDNLALQRTLNFWQKVITDFILHVYLVIRKDLNGVSDVKITLPIIPYMSTAKIHEYVDRDVISAETGKEYIVTISGLSEMDVFHGKNDHDIPPLHGNENQTTRIIDAKEKVMLSEAEKNLQDANRLKEQALLLKRTPGTTPAQN